MSTTIDRVPLHTAQAVNDRIERATGERLRRCCGNPLQIERRLRELDREWDVERVLETNASVVAFLGLALGTTVNRRWLLVPAAVTAFLFQHAVQGWCPPLPILRRLGVRTSREIEIERVALKILGGDFDDRPLPDEGRRRSDEALRIARA
jgi:hypothetical protein